jgi:hypothetical protein
VAKLTCKEIAALNSNQKPESPHDRKTFTATLVLYNENLWKSFQSSGLFKKQIKLKRYSKIIEENLNKG